MRWAGFLPQMLMRSTELSATTKLSAEHETPPIANVLLPAGGYLVKVCVKRLGNKNNQSCDRSGNSPFTKHAVI